MLDRPSRVSAVLFGAILAACGEPAPPQSLPLPPPSTAPTPAEPAQMPEAGVPEIADASAPEVSAPVIAATDAAPAEAQAPEPTFTPIAGATTRTTFKWSGDVRGAAIANAGIAGPKIHDAAAKVRGIILVRVTQCLRRGLDMDPSMSGRMTYTFTVRPNGDVDGAATVQASDFSPQVRACIAAGVRTVQFSPTGAAEPSMIRLTVVLLPP